MKKLRPRKPNKKRKEEKDAFFSEKENKAKDTSAQNSFFQPKLEISDPSDAFEQEADAVADHVISQENESVPGGAFGSQSVQRQAEEEEPAAKRIHRQAEEEEPAAKRIQRQAEEEEPAAKRIQRQAEEEEPAAKRIQRQAEEEEPAAKRIQRQAEEEEPAAKRIQRQAEEEEPAAKSIQRKEENTITSSTSQRAHGSSTHLVQSKSSSSGAGKKSDQQEMATIESMIQETKGRGLPLPEEVKGDLEAQLEADFSNVRIHTDEIAIQLAAALNAQAFTHGYDIYFNSGKYDPYSREGKHLLVHELTHVVQQKG